MQTAIIVGVDMPNSEYPIAYTLKELTNLAKACDIKVIGELSQNLEEINPKYFLL